MDSTPGAVSEKRFPGKDIVFVFRGKFFLLDGATWESYELSRDQWRGLPDDNHRSLPNEPSLTPPFSTRTSRHRARAMPPGSAPVTRRPEFRPGSYVIYVATDCNMDCDYCWNERGAIYPDQPRLTPERVDEMVDFMINNSSHRDELTVTLMGGEPLLRWPEVERLVRQLSSRFDGALKFELETNGTLLNAERIRFLRDHEIETHISVDGPPHLHDEHRVFRGGLPTFARIEEKWRLAQQMGLKFTVAATIVREALDDMDRVFAWLLEQFPSPSHRIVVSPVRHEMYTRGRFGGSLSREERQRYFDNYADIMLTRYYLRGLFPSLADPEITKRMRDLLYPRDSCDGYCGLCTSELVGNVVLTPDGALYPCHRWTGPEHRVGDLKGGFQGGAVYVGPRLSPACQDCWLLPLCGGGGCFAGNHHANHDHTVVDPDFCADFDYVTKLALYMLSELPDQAKRRLFPPNSG